ncbi:hypothetical protein [Brevibacillus reuszeri]|uniref:hypothetical protein n=1 Tax=Brevibacillus reuszeri TaxID=54915 RepID=UPI000CCBF1BE|nr:hypothetical protein [Brevibacillus reuszeri]
MITQDEELCMMIKGMAYRQPIIDRLDRQTEKGIKKYGHTIDKSGHLKSMEERCEYALEEATDLIVYLEDLRTHTKQIENERDMYLAELLAIRDLLMECLSETAPIEKIKWSKLTLHDLVEIRALAGIITSKYIATQKRLITERIES